MYWPSSTKAAPLFFLLDSVNFYGQRALSFFFFTSRLEFSTNEQSLSFICKKRKIFMISQARKNWTKKTSVTIAVITHKWNKKMIFFLSLVSQNNLFIVWVMLIYHFKLSIFRLFSTWWESHRNSRFLAMLFETIILLFLLELLLDRVLKRDKVILYVHTTKILLYASSKKLSWKRKSWSCFFLEYFVFVV